MEQAVIFIQLFFFPLKCLVRKDYKRKQIEQGAVTSKRTKGLKSRGFLFRLNQQNQGFSQFNGGSRVFSLLACLLNQGLEQNVGLGFLKPSIRTRVGSETCSSCGRILLTGHLAKLRGHTTASWKRAEDGDFPVLICTSLTSVFVSKGIASFPTKAEECSNHI